MSADQLLRCEVARMFGGWPHDLADKPLSYLRTLTDYYLAVKDAERKARDGESSDLTDEVIGG